MGGGDGGLGGGSGGCGVEGRRIGSGSACARKSQARAPAVRKASTARATRFGRRAPSSQIWDNSFQIWEDSSQARLITPKTAPTHLDAAPPDRPALLRAPVAEAASGSFAGGGGWPLLRPLLRPLPRASRLSAKRALSKKGFVNVVSGA